MGDPSQSCAWNVETLKEHVLRLFDEKDRAIQAALASQMALATMALSNADKAVAKAEAATERRFEGVNEFRATLADQQRNLIPRAEAELQMHALEESLAVLSRRMSAIEGRGSGLISGWSLALGAVGLISLIVSIIMVFVKRA